MDRNLLRGKFVRSDAGNFIGTRVRLMLLLSRGHNKAHTHTFTCVRKGRKTFSYLSYHRGILFATLLSTLKKCIGHSTRTGSTPVILLSGILRDKTHPPLMMTSDICPFVFLPKGKRCVLTHLIMKTSFVFMNTKITRENILTKSPITINLCGFAFFF